MDRQIAWAGLVLGPVLLIAGLAISVEPSAVERFLPIGTAWIQGVLALPMLLLAPWALSLAWTDAGIARYGTPLSRGIALAIALGVVGWVAANVSQLGCQPVTNAVQTLPVGAVWGGVAGLGFLIAVRAGRRYARDRRHLAAVVAGVGVGLLAFAADVTAFVLLFPPLSCAPPRIPV